MTTNSPQDDALELLRRFIELEDGRASVSGPMRESEWNMMHNEVCARARALLAAEHGEAK